MRILRDFSASTVTAGFVAALVGLTSSIAIVFTGARALGADDAMVTSWVWAVCIGMAVFTVVPSLRLRVPIMVVYSTPAAVIIASLRPGDFTMAEGVGAFLVAGALVVIVGFTGTFERLINKIPVALSSALLAGVLGRFALNGFADAATAPWLIVICTLTYVVVRLIASRYAVIAVLVVGVITAVASGTFSSGELRFSVARPIFTGPSFSLAAIIAISLPVFIVTMAGQNLPGVAAVRHAKYDVPISPIVGSTGLATLVLAPFGGYMFSMSAITAAICMEPASHEDPNRRYTAALSFGAFYLAAGIFGTSVTSALIAFPSELVHIVTTLALLPTIGANLAVATRDETHREAAMITFLVTLSGVTVAKIGSPFWGAAAGVLATVITVPTLARRNRS